MIGNAGREFSFTGGKEYTALLPTLPTRIWAHNRQQKTGPRNMDCTSTADPPTNFYYTFVASLLLPTFKNKSIRKGNINKVIFIFIRLK